MVSYLNYTQEVSSFSFRLVLLWSGLIVISTTIKFSKFCGFQFMFFCFIFWATFYLYIYISETKYILIVVKLKRRMRGHSHKVQNLIKVRLYSSTVQKVLIKVCTKYLKNQNQTLFKYL